MNLKWNWKLLDKELIKSYKYDSEAVSKFASKYSIPVRTIYKRLKKLNIETKTKWKPKIGKNSPNWKGGIGKSIVSGYVWVRIGKGKYISEHKLVMEKHLGRKLKRNEIVHHVDESFEARSNNDISNLQLVTRSWHQKHHNPSKRYCISFNKGTKNSWRLRIRNKEDTMWLSAGLYETKEEAIKVIENKGVGK